MFQPRENGKIPLKKCKCTEGSRGEVAVDNESKLNCVKDIESKVTVTVENEFSHPGPSVESEESEVTVESELSRADPS